MKQVFPKEIIESTVETHMFRHRTKSKIVYLIILLAVLTALALLPFTNVDVYSASRGIIKPKKERITISAPVSGKISASYLNTNQFVEKGDTLVAFDTAIIIEKLNFSKLQIEETTLFIEDLSYMIDAKEIVVSNLKSPKFQKEALLFKQKKYELHTKFNQLKRDYNRSKKLFDKGVIAKVEFETKTLEYDLIKSNIHQLQEQQYNTWQATLTSYKTKLVELESNAYQTQQNRNLYTVTAPISGTLVSSVSTGLNSYLQAGQTIAEMSPDTDLRIECYVSPYDIGLLKVNSDVNFQIDAYNYNQWGMASGRITDIAKDIEFIDNKAVFKVYCSISAPHLTLKNGYVGSLKKGMTLTAKFKLANRSLFDLLYDKVDDWINPGQNQSAQL
ncbi:MAG: HlyD family secretion protein [Flavobacteriaceae bacterium]|jgi:HlyD family secretion protein